MRRAFVVVLLLSGVVAGYGSALAHGLGYAGGWSGPHCAAESASAPTATPTPP
jgi:hypothetical protein